MRLEMKKRKGFFRFLGIATVLRIKIENSKGLFLSTNGIYKQNTDENIG